MGGGSPSAVATIAKKLSAKQNRFGGFGVVTDHYNVDFWALSTTWARTNGNIDIFRVEHILDSTFFNWDAVVYSLKTVKTYFRDSYIDDINNRILEINLEITPSYLENLIRALRRLFAWKALPGPRLLEYINGASASYNWQ